MEYIPLVDPIVAGLIAENEEQNDVSSWKEAVHSIIIMALLYQVYTADRIEYLDLLCILVVIAFCYHYL